MSISVLDAEGKFRLNFEIPLADQEQAAKALKKLKIAATQVAVVLWRVNGEYLTPSAFVSRVKEGHYGEANKETSDKPGREQREVEVSSRTGRPVGDVRNGRAPKTLRGNTDKRGDKQKGRSGNGRGTRLKAGGKVSRVQKETRKKAASVRKRRSRVS